MFDARYDQGPAAPRHESGWPGDLPPDPGLDTTSQHPADFFGREQPRPAPTMFHPTGHSSRHLRAVPQEEQPSVPSVEISFSFRNEVVSRLRRMSVLHTRAAWERRRRDPLGPHSVALFYLEPRVPVVQQLRTATRIFLADDEATDLPMLLYGLARHAHEGFGSDPRFDPRSHMVNKSDSMSSGAVFVGVGVCTLDTPYGDWATALRTAHDELDLPGRCYARLIDGTHLLVDRGGKRQFNSLAVECSVKDANVQFGVPSMQWNWNPALAEVPQSDPTFQIWRWMNELGRLIDLGSQPR
jgi:hypothetical protein